MKNLIKSHVVTHLNFKVIVSLSFLLVVIDTPTVLFAYQTSYSTSSSTTSTTSSISGGTRSVTTMNFKTSSQRHSPNYRSSFFFDQKRGGGGMSSQRQLGRTISTPSRSKVQFSSRKYNENRSSLDGKRYNRKLRLGDSSRGRINSRNRSTKRHNNQNKTMNSRGGLSLARTNRGTPPKTPAHRFFTSHQTVSKRQQENSSGSNNNYCSLSKSHTMCRYKQTSENSCGNVVTRGLSEREKLRVTDYHNQLRSRVATGSEKRGSPGPQPHASNMNKLEWDDELAQVAQRWADQCRFGHDKIRHVRRFKVGQNVYQKSSTTREDDASSVAMKSAVLKWYDEVSHFSNSQISIYRFRSSVGHYTQMVWADTTRVGCGLVTYKKENGYWIKTLLVCNYGPAGNFHSRSVYKVGTPCSKCEPSQSTCSVTYPGLCESNRESRVTSSG